MAVQTSITNCIDLPDGLTMIAKPVGLADRLQMNFSPQHAVKSVAGTEMSAPLGSRGRTAHACHVLDPLTAPEWDEWVNRWSAASVFHTSAWMAVLADTYGFKPLALVALAGDTPPALLPLMECVSPLSGCRGVALPFTDQAPALADTPAEARALFERALELGRERRWRSLELRGGSGLDLRSAAVTFFGHALELTPDTDALWSRLDDSVQRALRKAARAGVEVRRETTWESVEQFYRLHCQTRRGHGLPPQPLRFFEGIHRHLLARGAGCVFSAWHQGQIIAAAVFLHRGRQVVYKFGASDKNRQELRPNNAVMWAAIRYYATEGFASLDFGRTSCQQAGLRRFKLGWGTRETSVTYWKYDLRRGGFAVEKDRSTGWHTALFRRLPLPVLRWLGAALYPHLS